LISDFIQGLQNFYENDELYALVLPFNNFKMEYQTFKGMYNFNLLSRITRHVNMGTLMNEIPFLCIATDIETGKRF
jgi:NTE family protein